MRTFLSLLLLLLSANLFSSGSTGGTPRIRASAAKSISKAQALSSSASSSLSLKKQREKAQNEVNKINNQTKKKILSKDIGSKVKLQEKKRVGSAVNDLPVAVLGVDESIEDYLIENKIRRKREISSEKKTGKREYSFEDKAAIEFRRRYKKLYWKRYQNKRWSQFVQDHWREFRAKYVRALKKQSESKS